MGSILSGLPKGEGSGEINKHEHVYGQHFQARIFKKKKPTTPPPPLTKRFTIHFDFCFNSFYSGCQKLGNTFKFPTLKKSFNFNNINGLT